MISRFVRNFIALLFWVAITAACLYANAQTIIANYLGTKAGLELQGYEQQPLSSDPLVGQLFGTFFAGATLAQFFALGVAIVTSLTFFSICHIAGEVYELNELRIDTPNEDEKNRAQRRIYLWLVTAGVLLIPLVLAVSWDLDLFRFRTIADAMYAGEPDIKPLEYPGLSEFLGSYDRQYISALIRIGPWGYLAITVLSCILLEVAFRQLSDRWARLMQPIDDQFEPKEEFYGYDAEGQPVYDPAAEIAYDIDGNPVDFADDAILNQPVLVPRTDGEPNIATDSRFNGNGAPAGAMSANVAGAVIGNGELFDLRSTPASSSSDIWPDQVDEQISAADDAGLRVVIGEPDNRVSLVTAQSNPEVYRIDPITGHVWNRRFWQELHEDSELESAEGPTSKK